MLDYVSAAMAFYVTMLPVQEWILEFRLGYLGRYWSLISVAGLLIGFLLCALIFVPLIINMTKQFAIRNSQFAIKILGINSLALNIDINCFVFLNSN